VGRQFNLIAVGIGLSILGAQATFAQAPAPQNQQMRRPHGVVDRWMQLPPDERQIFERNAERWLRMTPQQQNLLRQREKILRARLKSEADSVLRQSGLELDQKRRALFEARYMQERRKMERQLRSEYESKRKQQLPTLSERLKKEFQSPASPVQRPASTPGLSVAPRR
jgi:hypothetical protein